MEKSIETIMMGYIGITLSFRQGEKLKIGLCGLFKARRPRSRYHADAWKFAEWRSGMPNNTAVASPP